MELFKEKFPAEAELIFHDTDCPISKPPCKANVLALTAVLRFEQPTCLQANILLDKCDESKGDLLAKELFDQLIPLYENKLLITDEYHTD